MPTTRVPFMCRSSICVLLMFIASARASGSGTGNGTCAGTFNATDNCDFYIDQLKGGVNCSILESKFDMDCSGCACKLPSTVAVTTPPAAVTTLPVAVTTLPADLEKEVAQANEFAESLQKSLDDGDLTKQMANSDALKQVTEVKVDDLVVKKADANDGTPTQIEGKCQLTGLTLSEFQAPQRDAFKSAMAAASGADSEDVLIKNVSAVSRRRLRQGQANRRQLLGSSILIEFAIIVDSQPETQPEPQPDATTTESTGGGQENLSAGAVAGIVVGTIFSVIAVALVTVVVVMVVYRKLNKKQNKIARALSDVQMMEVHRLGKDDVHKIDVRSCQKSSGEPYFSQS